MTESNKVCYYNTGNDVLALVEYGCVCNVFFPSGLAIESNFSIVAQKINRK